MVPFYSRLRPAEENASACSFTRISGDLRMDEDRHSDLCETSPARELLPGLDLYNEHCVTPASTPALKITPPNGL